MCQILYTFIFIGIRILSSTLESWLLMKINVNTIAVVHWLMQVYIYLSFLNIEIYHHIYIYLEDSVCTLLKRHINVNFSNFEVLLVNLSSIPSHSDTLRTFFLKKMRKKCRYGSFSLLKYYNLTIALAVFFVWIWKLVLKRKKTLIENGKFSERKHRFRLLYCF